MNQKMNFVKALAIQLDRNRKNSRQMLYLCAFLRIYTKKKNVV